MKSAILAILFALLTASLAGCMEGDAGGPDGTPSDSDGAGLNATAVDQGPGANEPPVIVAKIIVNGTQVTLANDSYAVPSAENITFDASGSSGGEGANLTFQWDFGDGNSSDEAIAVYAYANPGNYSVQLTVQAGNESAQAEFPIVAASSGPAPGTPLTPIKQTFTGTYTVGLQNPVSACIGSTQGSGHTFTHTLTIPATELGAAVRVSMFKLTLSGGTTALDQAMRLAGPDGKTIKDTDAVGAADNKFVETATVEGAFKPGDYKLTVYGCVVVNATYKLEVEATTVAA